MHCTTALLYNLFVKCTSHTVTCVAIKVKLKVINRLVLPIKQLLCEQVYNFICNCIEASPSTMMIAVEFSRIFRSLHCTGEGLFSEEILWKVKLAGLVVDDSSGMLNPGNRLKTCCSYIKSTVLLEVTCCSHSNIPKQNST